MKEQVLESRIRYQLLKSLRMRIVGYRVLEILYSKWGFTDPRIRLKINFLDASFRLLTITYTHVICADFQKVIINILKFIFQLILILLYIG